MYKILTILAFMIGATAHAQDTYEIIRAVTSHINPNISILDTLPPFGSLALKSKSAFKAKAWDTLTRAERRELRRNAKKDKGQRIDENLLPSRNVIPTLHAMMPSLNGYPNPILYYTTPYYLIDNPILFSNNTKAVVFVTIIRGFSGSYLLEKKQGKWIVLKEFDIIN